MFHINAKNTHNITLIASIDKDQDVWKIVKEKNKIVFYLPSEINLPELGKKLVQYFRKLNEPINIDVDSFIKHYNPQWQCSMLLTLFSNNEAVFDIPFSQKTKEQKFLINNFMISKSFSNVILKEALTIIEAEKFARKYEWMPANLCTGDRWEKEIISKFREFKNDVKINVLDKSQLIKKKMELILGVGKASPKENWPRLITLEYNNKPSAKRIAFVGKGILFDTGGVSLKTPPAKMQRMHSDMTGAAVVLGTILALVKMKAKVNVVGVLAIARNDVGSEAYVVQDILKSYEGTTVEIVNTDSEGRLVLADGIAYAWKDLKAKTILTIGTLSGGTIYALGQTYTPIWTTNGNDWKIMQKAAQYAGEFVWPMPFNDEYRQELYTSKMADISNTNLNMVASGCVSAEFMKTFIGPTDYIHCDIVGSVEYTNTPIPTLLKTLVYFAKEYK